VLFIYLFFVRFRVVDGGELSVVCKTRNCASWSDSPFCME